MAEKKPPQDEKDQFELEMYRLGLELVESYRKGTCPDRDKTLNAAIKILEITKRD